MSGPVLFRKKQIDSTGDGGEAFAAMPSKFLLPWSCEEPDEGQGKKRANRNKVRYTCTGCATNVWGKPGLAVVCGDCEEAFEEGT